MSRMVVTSLFTDQGPRKDEFGALLQQMTGSVSVPMYVVYDPVADRRISQYDYNQMIDADVADDLARDLRRFERAHGGGR